MSMGHLSCRNFSQNSTGLCYTKQGWAEDILDSTADDSQIKVSFKSSVSNQLSTYTVKNMVCFSAG
jgi:hypothetical protein